MHFVVSWDIPSTTPNRENYDSQLIACFGQNANFKPLTTFYIVRVAGQPDYASIVTNLQNVGRTIPGAFRLIISPLMTGGRYDGLHESSVWQTINQLSI